MAVPAELIELIRCPRCRGRLALIAADPQAPVGHAPDPALACAACQVAYPVIDDVPQLLIDEARPLSPGAGAAGQRAG